MTKFIVPRRFYFYIFGLFVLLGLSFLACDNGSTSTTIPIKVVEEKYRFNNGSWDDVDGNQIENAVSTIDKNSFTVTGGGVEISYLNVYTTDSNSFTNNPSWGNGSWAYLYDSTNKKIGIAIIWGESKYRTIFIGNKSILGYSDADTFNIILDDIQVIDNGAAQKYNPSSICKCNKLKQVGGYPPT